MRSFRDHLQEELQDKGFRDIFDEEKELVQSASKSRRPGQNMR